MFVLVILVLYLVGSVDGFFMCVLFGIGMLCCVYVCEMLLFGEVIEVVFVCIVIDWQLLFESYCVDIWFVVVVGVLLVGVFGYVVVLCGLCLVESFGW